MVTLPPFWQKVCQASQVMGRIELVLAAASVSLLPAHLLREEFAKLGVMQMFGTEFTHVSGVEVMFTCCMTNDVEYNFSASDECGPVTIEIHLSVGVTNHSFTVTMKLFVPDNYWTVDVSRCQYGFDAEGDAVGRVMHAFDVFREQELPDSDPQQNKRLSTMELVEAAARLSEVVQENVAYSIDHTALYELLETIAAQLHAHAVDANEE